MNPYQPPRQTDHPRVEQQETLNPSSSGTLILKQGQQYRKQIDGLYRYSEKVVTYARYVDNADSRLQKTKAKISETQVAHDKQQEMREQFLSQAWRYRKEYSATKPELERAISEQSQEGEQRAKQLEQLAEEIESARAEATHYRKFKKEFLKELDRLHISAEDQEKECAQHLRDYTQSYNQFATDIGLLCEQMRSMFWHVATHTSLSAVQYGVLMEALAGIPPGRMPLECREDNTLHPTAHDYEHLMERLRLLERLVNGVEGAWLRVEYAIPAHMQGVLRLANPWQQSDVTEFLQESRSFIACAILNQQVVGFLCAAEHNQDLEIVKVVVDRDFQRLGIGQRMVSHVTQNSQLDEQEPVKVFVEEQDVAAQCFFRACGFRTHGTLVKKTINSTRKAGYTMQYDDRR
jgi:ribosomal protein S18 acetylase RimI-like enzyme